MALKEGLKIPVPLLLAHGSCLGWICLPAEKGKSFLVPVLYRIKQSSDVAAAFDLESITEWRKPWIYSLVGKFLARSPPLPVLKDFFGDRSWTVSAPSLILDMPNEFFFPISVSFRGGCS